MSAAGRRLGGWPLVVAAAVAAAGCGGAAGAPTAPLRGGSAPTVRVGLRVGVAEARVGAAGGGVEVAGGGRRRTLGDGARLTVTAAGGRVAVREWTGSEPADTLRFTPTGSAAVTVDGTPYRGTIRVVAGGGGLTVVNDLSVEAYLPGVVGAELGPRAADDRAAVEAQAIVSRTYALRNMGRFADLGFDVRAGVADQVYGGLAAENAEAVRAVRATAGRVVVHEGALIAPFFHSTCGAATAAPEEAFRTVGPAPYLQPVSDARPGGGYYNDISPRFAWEVSWEGDELREVLRRTVPRVLGIDAAMVDRVEDVYVRRSGPSGRVLEARIRVGQGEIPVFGPDVRAVFEPPEGGSLGSSAIRFAVEREDGRVVRLVASGSGWGHGVGLCQWGALGRARAGQDHRAIVTTYFPGASIARWY